MGRSDRKILTFQSGEISPRAYGRSDTDLYNKGLAVAENVTIDKRGGAFKRGGLQHFGRIDGNNARIFTLQASTLRYYTLIAYHQKLLVIAPGASFLDANLLLNGNFAAAGANWNTNVNPATSQVLFAIGQCQLLPEQAEQNYASNPDFAIDGVGWTRRESPGASSVSFTDGVAVLIPASNAGAIAGLAQSITVPAPTQPHAVDIKGDFLDSSLTLKVGTAEADGTYLDIVITQPGRYEFTPPVSPFWITVDCNNPDVAALIESIHVYETAVQFSEISQMATVVAAITDPHTVIVGQQGVDRLTINVGTTDGGSDIATITSTDHEIALEFIPNNATYWVTVRAEANHVTSASITFVGTATASEAGGLGEEMDATWDETQLNEIHMIESPSGKTLYFTHPNLQPQKLVYNRGTDTFVPLADVEFTNKPDDWTGTNWPATGTHYEGRLWLAATPDLPQTLWGSYSGKDEDFLDLEIPAEGEDAIPTAATRVMITLRDFGRIEWMLGTKNLLVGAENGEHLITSDAGVITSLDFNVEQQSSFGSNNMRGIQVGEKVFYLTPDGRKLRAMNYQWEEDNWLSEDLTVFAEHITLSGGFSSAWGQHPNNLFSVVLNNGTLAVLTYDRTAATIAWTRIIPVGLKVLDIATGRTKGTNEIVIVGQRVPGKLDIELHSDARQYLDSYVSKFDAGGTNLIDGLDHLEGQVVRPIVDGAVEPLKTVVGGQITTQRIGQQLYAGVGYTSKIKTLPPDVPQSQIRSWRKRWNKVWALMLDSKQPIINGVRPPDRTPSTPMDTVEPNQSTHFKTVNLGWDDFGQITIEEDLPVAMNVLAIYGEMGGESVG